MNKWDSYTEGQYQAALTNWRKGALGTPDNPRRGASHRNSFWDGYFGVGQKPCHADGCAAAHHRAGRDAARLITKADPTA